MRYSFGEYKIDKSAYQLLANGVPVAVEPQVFDLLLLLAANAGRVVTRDEILERIWNGRIVSEAALSSRIKAARRAIGDSGKDQRFIRTIHGRGFVFEGAVEREDTGAAMAAAAARPTADPIGQGESGGEPAPSERTETLTREVMQRPAIAVLPFVDASSPAGLDHRSAGITEEIIAAISAWRWFPVIARNTTFRYARCDKPADVIGRETGARYLVTGSLRRSGGTIKLSAALVDAQANRELWNASYRRAADEIFDIEEELAREIVSALESHVDAAEMGRIRLKAASDITAWDLAWQANQLAHQGGLDVLDEAERLALMARDRDPGWSNPHALVAFIRFQRAMHSWSGSDPKTAFADTLAAARDALKVDGGSWMAHALSGVGELWTHGNHDRALAHLHHALQINPSACWSYHFGGCISGFAGDLDAARRLQSRVFNVDPVYPYTGVVEADLALWSMLAGDIETAEEHIANSTRWDPDYGRGQHRAMALYGIKGNRAAARDLYRQLAQRGISFDPGYIRESYPFRDPDHRDRFFDGLRKAGINI